MSDSAEELVAARDNSREGSVVWLCGRVLVAAANRFGGGSVVISELPRFMGTALAVICCSSRYRNRSFRLSARSFGMRSAIRVLFA